MSFDTPRCNVCRMSGGDDLALQPDGDYRHRDCADEDTHENFEPCPTCDGHGGWTEAECCGNGLETGECCNNPVPGQRCCDDCGGAGRLPVEKSR